MSLDILERLVDEPMSRLIKTIREQPNRSGQLLDNAIRDGLPKLLAAAIYLHWAEDESDPDEQRRALFSYLKLHCAEDLNAKQDTSLVELMRALLEDGSNQQQADFGLATLRAYAVDTKWYVGSRLDEHLLSWLTDQWGILSGQGPANRRPKTAGPAGSAALDNLKEREHQLTNLVRHWTQELSEGDIERVRDVLRDFCKQFEKQFGFLTLQEQIYSRAGLRLFQRLADRLQERGQAHSIVESAEETRELIDEIERVRAQLSTTPESVFVMDEIRLLVSLGTRLRSELAGWGELVPRLIIRPERGTYTFVDGLCEPVLLVLNDGVVTLDSADLILAVGDGTIEPDQAALTRLEPGEEARLPILISPPPGKHRFSTQWMVSNVRTGYGDAPDQDGSFDIEIDHGLDWGEISRRPNAYFTRPVDQPDRLFGRSRDLEVLNRAIRSGESRYLTGQRRVGKTSLIRVLLDQLDTQAYLPVYAEWGEIGSTALGGFAGVCSKLAEKISLSIGQLKPELRVAKPPPLEEFKQSFNGSLVGYITETIKSSGLQLVIALDDFDDVPPWVYSGEEADLFFSMIKVLTGKRGISIVFVGGQKLQKIMRSPVAAKLNQVTPVNLDNLGREAAKDLISQPAKDVLRFDNRATDRMYYWSSGNPFYANRICNHLWDHMVASQHSHVIDSDVDRVVEEAARNDDSQLFVHFWHDGIWGDGSENQQAIWETGNCLVLWSLGRLQAGDRTSEYFPVDLIRREAHLADSEARQWVGDLMSRGVLTQHPEDPDQYRAVVRYFQLWLSRRGFSELYSLIDPKTTESITAEGQIPDEEIEQILGTAKLRYRGELVTPYEIRKFLDQFGSIENQSLVLPLVRRLLTEGFLDQATVKEAAEDAVKHLAVTARLQDPDFVTKLSPTDDWTNLFAVFADDRSSKPLGDVVRQVASLSRLQMGNAERLVEFVSKQRASVAVLLFDDFVGTGRTARRAVEESVRALDEAGLLGKTACVLFYAVAGFKDVIEHLNGLDLPKCVFFARRLLLPSDQAFDPEARIFESNADLDAARRLASTIGAKLEPDSPLGYGGMQALLASYRNTPNITLPIFWKPSAKRSFQWKPLFRRT
jgi:hypothetical protein